MKLDSDTLRRLSPLLDQAFERDESQREAWLCALDGEAAELAPLLRELLFAAFPKAAADLLERGPDFNAMGSSVLGTAAEFSAGDAVGPYRLLHQLGVGGMGEVWLAERVDGALKRAVALKLPMFGLRHSALIQRFARERDILATLEHRNIARLYDAGITGDGQPYLALEYVRGQPVTQYADHQGLDAHARVRLLRQVMEAVQYAHANLVIHRDLKPGNVLVDVEGKAMLLDFGIAKLLEHDSPSAIDSEITREGGRPLTPFYAAPEQLRGQAVSIATDVWALGVLLYQLGTGLLPFGSAKSVSLEHDVLLKDPMRPSQHRCGAIVSLSRGLAADLDTIVLKALKKEPAQRYPTVMAFADDLDRWLKGEPVLARPDSAWYRSGKFVGRHKVFVATGASALLVILFVATAAVALGLRASDEAARAIAAREFLIDLFRQTDPDLVRGKEVSARQLLEQGRKTILETMAAQPLLQAELLQGIGDALDGMEEFAGADEAYAQVAQVYRRQGRPREAANAILDQAVIAGDSLEDIPRLQALLAQAAEVYPSARADEEFKARYLILQMIAAFLRGDMQQQREFFNLVRPIADRALSSSSRRAVHAIRTLAESEGQMGLYQSGIDRLNRLMTELEARKTTPPAQMLGVLDDLAELESQAGRFRAAMQRYETANAYCQKSLNPKGSQCDFTQYGRARVLLILGFHDRAMETLPNLLNKMKGWQPTNVIRAYSVLGKNKLLGQYPEVSSRIRAMGDSGRQPGQADKTSFLALVAQAEYHLQEQRPDDARTLLDQAESQLKSAHLNSWYLITRLRMSQGLLDQSLGHFETALVALQETTRMHVSVVGPEHPATLLVSAHQARALWASRQQEKALQLLDRAVPVLEDAMGSDAPNLIRLKSLRQELATTTPNATTARKVDLFL